MLTLCAPPYATTNPHASVQVQISRITSLHMYVEPEAVGLWIHLICLGWVVQLLEDVARTNTPSFVLDADKCRRVVVGLEKVGRFEVGGEVGCDELFVLTTGLEQLMSVERQRRDCMMDVQLQSPCPNVRSNALRCS